MDHSNGFKDVALKVDTEKTQNLELLLDAADFAKFPAMEDFKHYELHKALLGTWDANYKIESGPVMISDDQ